MFYYVIYTQMFAMKYCPPRNFKQLIIFTIFNVFKKNHRKISKVFYLLFNMYFHFLHEQMPFRKIINISL